MQFRNRHCEVLVSAMLVALALGGVPGAAAAGNAMGGAARDGERHTTASERFQAERGVRIARERAHARMSNTMYASTPDRAPPPHPAHGAGDTRRLVTPTGASVLSGEDSATVTHFVGLFPSASDTLGRQGFARVVNRSGVDGEVRIDAYDDAGEAYGPVTLGLGAGETAHFNSDDLEAGNAAKGLEGSTGAGEGHWRLEFTSALELEVLAYIRTNDGFLTSMHDVVPRTEAGHRVVTFNPGRNTNQVSRLRLINRGAQSAEVHIEGIDDDGETPGVAVALSVEGGASRTVSAQALESGQGVSGALGTGSGKWRLVVSADRNIEVMSLLSSPTGHLTNLSTAPSRAADTQTAADVFRAHISEPVVQSRCIHCHVEGGRSGHTRLVFAPSTNPEHETLNLATFERFVAEVDDAANVVLNKIQGVAHGGGVQVAAGTADFANMERFVRLLEKDDVAVTHFVGLFPSASDTLGRQGFARVVNRSGVDGEVRIDAYDDAGEAYGPVTLGLGAGETAHFNSDDLEAGNAAKGLEGSTGAGEGHWRLEFTSALELEVLAYIRTNDGFLTSMHDVVPRTEAGHRVVTFNPGRNTNQVSRLRLINRGAQSAEVHIEGIDDDGETPGVAVALSVEGGASRTVSAQALESGQGVSGALGTGSGKWRLVVSADRNIEVMSLLSSPTGHLTNLSTAPSRAADTQTAADVFRAHISEPVVQSRCIHCHVEGGRSGHTRLVFETSTNPEHEALNLATFERFVAEVDDAAKVVLNKIQGVAHGGGVQVAAGTADFANMERFLRLLGEDVSTVVLTPETLFDTVRMAPARKTLRRAALIFAGRIPTDAEYAAAQQGGAALRSTIRGLMEGPEFHEFLLRGANDRLLTDRFDDSIGVLDVHLLDFANENYRRRAAAHESDDWREFNRWRERSEFGANRAPLELIAHVVENDLPYTQILTADYIMANPWAAAAYGASTRFRDPEDMHEFGPSRIVTYYREGDGYESEYDPVVGARRILSPGPLITDYPHAGILNTTMFLLRYPTTATNRNRARSRWTYYHFLGLDIEKSASRTTDPVALADTNNPTMFNPACTVCHRVLDPVAGAFQNYFDEGQYKTNRGGVDSLDEFYRNPEGTVFEVHADSWENRQTFSVTEWFARDSGLVFRHVNNNYCDDNGCGTFDRDLRLDELVVRSSPGGPVVHRVTWEVLDEHCLHDGRYNGGTTGADDHYQWWGWDCDIPLQLPADSTYTVELVAWADRSGDELAKLAFGAKLYKEGDTWYRDMRAPGFGDEIAPSSDNSVQWLAERIVADERFAEAAVKFWWPTIMGSEVAEPPQDEGDTGFEGLLLAANAQGAEVTRLADGFRRGFPSRAAYNLKDLLVEIVLSKWFRADALEGEDPVRRIALQDAGARRLLTPEELARKTVALTGLSWGRHVRTNCHPRCDPRPNALTDEYRLLYGGIDSDGIAERARDVTSVMAGVAKKHALEVSCQVVMRELFLLPESERYLFAGIDQYATPSRGADIIRNKLVELHDKLLGVQATPHSPDVEAAYRLFVDVWERNREAQHDLFDRPTCPINDLFFFEGILDDAVMENGDGFEWDRVNAFLDGVDWSDPHSAAQTWVPVLAYLLMDYRYLYL